MLARCSLRLKAAIVLCAVATNSGSPVQTPISGI
jgi:hypothetical protein